MPPGQALEALLGALVHVEQPELQVEHRFAGDAEPEMARLDDACMDGTDRHLEHALAGDRAKRMEISFDARHRGVVREIPPQGPRALRPVRVQRHALGIGMLGGGQPEEVHDLALEPVGGRVTRGDGGKDRRGRFDGRRESQKRVVARQRPDMMDAETAGGVTIVGGEHRHQTGVQPRGQRVGEARQRGGRRGGRPLSGMDLPERPAGSPEGIGQFRNRRHDPPATTAAAARTRARSEPGR